MNKKTVTSLAFAAGCALAAFAAVPSAQAATPGWSAHRNNIESAQYQRLLQTNWNFRQARIRKECSPIGDPQLRHNCVASFDQYTPFLGSRGRMMARTTPVHRETRTTADNYTTNPYAGYENAPGYGSSAPPYSTDPYAHSRNLPGEYSGGMIQAPGAMPSYPGPRVSGPLSGR